MEKAKIFLKWSNRVAWFLLILASLVLILRIILSTNSTLGVFIQTIHFWSGEIAIGSLVYLFVFNFVFKSAFQDAFYYLFERHINKEVMFQGLVGILAFFVIMFTSITILVPHKIAEFLGINGLNLSYRSWMGTITIISGIYLILLPFLRSNQLDKRNFELLFIFCTLSAIGFFNISHVAFLRWISIGVVCLFFVVDLVLKEVFEAPRRRFYEEHDKRETEFFNSFPPPPTTMDVPLIYWEIHGSPSKREKPTLRILWIIQVVILIISLVLNLFAD